MQYYGRVSQQTKLRSKLTGVGGQKGQLQWCPVGLCTEYNTQHLCWRSLIQHLLFCGRARQPSPPDLSTRPASFLDSVASHIEHRQRQFGYLWSDEKYLRKNPTDIMRELNKLILCLAENGCCNEAAAVVR